MTTTFKPHTINSTLAISAGTGSTRIALTSGGTWRVYNAGTGAAFIEFGSSSVAASLAGGMPIAPGSVEVITPPSSASGATHVAAITSTGTSILYFTAGEGIEQVLHWGAGKRFIRWAPSASAAQTAASALIAAMTPAPDATRQTLIRSTFDALATILPNLDQLFVTAAHDAQGARLNWVDPTGVGLTASNSPTFVIDRGYTSDGATSRLITTGKNMSALTKYTQDNCSMFGWSRTDGGFAIADYGATGGGTIYAIIRSATNFMQSKLNSSTLGQSAVANAIGFFGQSRNNSANYDQYKNGTLITNVAAATSAVSAFPFTICSGQAQFSSRQMAAGGTGAYMTAGEWLTLYNALQAYMTAVGA